MKKLLLVLLCTALIFSAVACGSAQPQSTEVMFKVAINSEYDTLNFFSTESMMVYDFFNFTYDSLIAYDRENNAIPRLATEWEVSPDGLTWTFKLQENAKFSDGEPLTSADVKWTYENAVESYMYSTHASGFASIECPDDYTVVFNCEYPKPDMLFQIIPILPEHIWSGVEDIFSYENIPLVGSGPFVYDEARSSNGNIAFVKNANYWGTPANVDVLVFTLYDNDDAAAQALQLGEVDACYELTQLQYDTLSSDSKYYVGKFTTYGFEYLGYNQLDPMMADKTIRHAIDYCLDRDVAIEMGYGGLGTPAYGPVSNQGYTYTPDADVMRAFSTDKANELLDEAGYLDTDGDGIREKDGQPLSFELITAAERSSWQSAVVNMLITNCAAAGMELKWNAMETVTMWDTCYDGNPDWQMCLDGWGGDADPAAIMCIFLDWEVAGYAGVGYANSEFDVLYDGASSTIDEAQRAEYIQQCQALLYEDCPYTYICFDMSVQAINAEKWTGFATDDYGLFANERNDTYVNIKPAS